MKKHKRLSISERMKRVKSKGTVIEQKFAQLLRLNNIHYQGHPKIFGHPDFKIKGTKILIFCDSSFWHGRNKNEVSGKAFKANRNFWVKKLKYNKALDKRTSRALKRQGWTVVRFWDDAILKHPLLAISKLNHFLKKEES